MVDDRRRRPGADDRQLRRQADPLPRRLDRRARGQRDGQRPRGRRARGRWRSASRWCSRRACRRDVLRAEVEAIAAAAEAAGVEIVAGDTKVVERGHGDAMYVCTTGVGRVDARARSRPRRSGRATAILVSGTIGEHGTAIMLARGEFELDADDRVRHPLAVAGGRRAAGRGGHGAALHARRDARRGRLGAQRAGARLRRGDDRARGRRAGAAGGRRRRGDPRDRPDVRRQRGQARRLRRAGGGGRGAGGAARGAGLRGARPRSAR